MAWTNLRNLNNLIQESEAPQWNLVTKGMLYCKHFDAENAENLLEDNLRRYANKVFKGIATDGKGTMGWCYPELGLF